MRGIHPKIWNLLFHRFLCATWMCFYLEYQLLIIFLLFMRFDIQHAGNYVRDVLSWSIFSVYTWSRLFVMMLMAVPYGLILCHIHQRQPIRHCSWLEIVRRELPMKLCLLTLLISLGYGNSCIYHSFLLKMDMKLNESLNSRYLMVSGCFCGLYHFWEEHCRLDREIWPLPLMHQAVIEYHWLRWPNIWLGLHKSVILMLPLAVFYWPSWQVLGQACCLSILITAKLKHIKCIYGTSMHRKLPLTLLDEIKYQREELELPLILALSTTALHGFQLQVAKAFYDIMANTRNKACRHLFELYEPDDGHESNWTEVRDILMARIKYFMRQLDYSLGVNNDPIAHVKPAKEFSKMRPLMHGPANPESYYSCLQRDLPEKPVCQPRTANSDSIFCLCPTKLLTKLKVIWTSQNNLEYTLHSNLSLSWLIQGLVCICLRSRKEDKNGLVQADLGLIFQLLMDLEKLLRLVKKFQKVKSPNLANLLLATSLSLNKLIIHFKPHLECIIEDEKLLMELQSRK